MSSTHHISRLQYRVACPDEGQAFELRNLLSAIVTEELASKMEEVSDHYVPEDEFVRIPRLEVNLQSTSLNTLAVELRDLFGLKLEEQLQWMRHHPEPDGLERRELEIQALFYFLQNGTLPHWAAVLQFQIDEVAMHVLHQQHRRLLGFLRNNASNRVIWVRIQAQLNREVREEIICAVHELADTYTILKHDYAKWRSGNLNPETPAEREAVATQTLAVILMDARTILAGAASPEVELQHLLTLMGIPEGPIDSGGKTPPLSPVMSGDLNNLSDEIPHASLDPDADTTMMTAMETGHLIIEKIAVRTSGIILLHPFLKPFFTELRLMEDGAWVDKAAQQRAVHILHYLGTGLQEQAEWNLVLEKLLCGMHPAMPVERNIELTDAETLECEQLLSAVIKHWAALKNTSPQGLQGTFIKRDGMLEETEKGWMLRVERKTQDVLLEALPWGYTMIQLAWNEYLIEVIW